MPGTNAGTGEPITFRCFKGRREAWRFSDTPREHRTARTGRSRRYYRRSQGIRTMDRTYEYTCSCGYRGWSAHRDILRSPGPR